MEHTKFHCRIKDRPIGRRQGTVPAGQGVHYVKFRPLPTFVFPACPVGLTGDAGRLCRMAPLGSATRPTLHDTRLACCIDGARPGKDQLGVRAQHRARIRLLKERTTGLGTGIRALPR